MYKYYQRINGHDFYHNEKTHRDIIFWLGREIGKRKLNLSAMIGFKIPVATNIGITGRKIKGGQNVSGWVYMDEFVAFYRPLGDARVIRLDKSKRSEV